MNKYQIVYRLRDKIVAVSDSPRPLTEDDIGSHFSYGDGEIQHVGISQEISNGVYSQDVWFGRPNSFWGRLEDHFGFDQRMNYDDSAFNW